MLMLIWTLSACGERSCDKLLEHAQGCESSDECVAVNDRFELTVHEENVHDARHDIRRCEAWWKRQVRNKDLLAYESWPECIDGECVYVTSW